MSERERETRRIFGTSAFFERCLSVALSLLSRLGARARRLLLGANTHGVAARANDDDDDERDDARAAAAATSAAARRPTKAARRHHATLCRIVALDTTRRRERHAADATRRARNAARLAQAKAEVLTALVVSRDAPAADAADASFRRRRCVSEIALLASELCDAANDVSWVWLAFGYLASLQTATAARALFLARPEPPPLLQVDDRGSRLKIHELLRRPPLAQLLQASTERPDGQLSYLRLTARDAPS